MAPSLQAAALAAVLAVALAASPSSAADRALADGMDAYLVRHVLAPRFPACVDREHGGFHANFASDWTKQPDRHRFVVYQARNTWNAAAVALARPALRQEYLAYARHGIAFLRDRQWDRERGGFFDAVPLAGAPELVEGATKMTYGQAFGVYALAVAHRAAAEPAALELAQRAWRWVEDHCREPGRSGYLTGVRVDGGRVAVDADAVAPANLPGMGVPVAYRDMNTHIHLLEAWTELLKEWPDPRLRESTRRLFELLRDAFYSEPGTLHLFLDPEGRPVAGPSSFGHDVETGFLLLEAAAALGVPEDPRTQRVARRLVDHALAVGWNAETGQLYEEGFAIRPAFDRSVQWWAQFELVNALSLMDALHGRETPRYREALARAWAFTRERLTDEQHGGVYAGVDGDGRVLPAKSNDWFAGYHTSRALLLTAARLRGEPR
ncbi:MAG TPA: AGE family epimerase/isomerase [Vicinamibacteria bacterium]|nr:AGE family epimerase/isomerase [Vicinamibacteria bacterium]